MTGSERRAETLATISGKLFGRSGSLFGGKRHGGKGQEPETPERRLARRYRYPPVTTPVYPTQHAKPEVDEECRGRSPGQDKNRRRSRSRSMIRGVSQAVGAVQESSRRFSFITNGFRLRDLSPVRKRASSRSISRARPVAIDESILLYEKTRVNASIQLRLNHLLAGTYKHGNFTDFSASTSLVGGSISRTPSFGSNSSVPTAPMCSGGSRNTAH
jgi:hypothetical protein